MAMTMTRCGDENEDSGSVYDDGDKDDDNEHDVSLKQTKAPKRNHAVDDIHGSVDSVL